jgi:hypothetical protein
VHISSWKCSSFTINIFNFVSFLFLIIFESFDTSFFSEFYFFFLYFFLSIFNNFYKEDNEDSLSFRELYKNCFFDFIFLCTWILLLTVILKVDPCPSILLTKTWPPIYSTILLHILKPSPVPYKFLYECSSSLPKSINKFFIFYYDIPTP